MSSEQLFKQCELRRFVQDGRVEREIRWLEADDADVGRTVLLPTDDGGVAEWEVVSAPEPAMPARIVELFDADFALARCH